MEHQWEITIDEAIIKHKELFVANADSSFDIIEILKLALPEYCEVDKPLMSRGFLDEEENEPEGIELTDEWEAGFEITWHWDKGPSKDASVQAKQLMVNRAMMTLEMMLDSHGRYSKKAYSDAVLDDIGPSLWFEARGSHDTMGVRYVFDDSTR